LLSNARLLKDATGISDKVIEKYNVLPVGKFILLLLFFLPVEQFATDTCMLNHPVTTFPYISVGTSSSAKET
jgi:hypothetical protein